MMTLNSEQILAAVAKGQELDRLKGLHVDHDGTTLVHRARILRADGLADGRLTFRRDELQALVRPLAVNGGLLREGRADDPPTPVTAGMLVGQRGMDGAKIVYEKDRAVRPVSDPAGYWVLELNTCLVHEENLVPWRDDLPQWHTAVKGVRPATEFQRKSAVTRMRAAT